MNLFDGFLTELATGDQIKDYKHASRLFVDNNYALSPKYDWLYHVFFDFDPQLVGIMGDKIKTIEAGMLVKSVDLPKFAIETRNLNNYNRPNIIQTKIKYQPISISFHDDQSNVVRNFWYDYFNFYYRDTDIGYAGAGNPAINQTYFQRTKYVGGDRTQVNKFGYTPRNNGLDGAQFIRAIRLYSLHQKRFTEYTILNPVISDFSHGSHGSSQNGILENIMTIQYETVLYQSGYVTPSTVLGFADLHYDKSPSPLSAAGGGTNSFLGPGGIVSAIDGFVRNPAGGAFGLIRSFQKNKNINLGKLATTELASLATAALSGQNPLSRIFIPTTGNYSTSSKIVSGMPNEIGASASSATSNGLAVGGGIVAGALSFIGSKTGLSGTSTAVAGANLNNVVNLNASGSQTSQTPQFSFNFLQNALTKFQTYKKTKVEAEQAKEAQKISSGYADAAAKTEAFNAGQIGNSTLTEISNGVAYAANFTKGATVFDTGTSTGATFGNPLGLTPNFATIIASSQNVASSESAAFVNNGNPFNIVPSGSINYSPSSTPPAPSNLG